MVITRAFPVAAVFAAVMFAQATAPAFEVATIKAAAPIQPAQVMAGKLHIGMTVDGQRVDIGGLSLSQLIGIAYKMRPYQISGPEWLNMQRFDVMAKLPEGATKDQVPQMLQALLEERFHLAVHRESKEHPVYALVVGKGGSKLKEAAPDADAPPPAGGGLPEGRGGGNQVSISREGQGITVRGGAQAGPVRMSMGPGGAMHLEASKLTMSGLADMLTSFMDRPVVDMTELKGNYQVGLDLSMDDLRNAARTAGVMMPGMAAGGPPGLAGGPGAGTPPSAPAASDPAGGSSIFNTVQQLGLKLEPRKSPLDTLYIDHADKTPTEN